MPVADITNQSQLSLLLRREADSQSFRQPIQVAHLEMAEILDFGEVKESFKNLMKAASFSLEYTRKTLHLI